MKTTTRRILALLLTVCSLLSVMAPTAFAAEETTTGPQADEYDFHVNSVLTETANNTTYKVVKAHEDGVNAYYKFNSKTANGTDSKYPMYYAIEEAYDRAGSTLKWKIGLYNGALVSNQNTQFRTEGYYGLRVCMQSTTLDDSTKTCEGTWVSFPIKSPNAGTYTFELSYGIHPQGIKTIGVYIISYKESLAQTDIQSLLDQTNTEELNASAKRIGTYSCKRTDGNNYEGVRYNFALDKSYTFAEDWNHMIVLEAEEATAATSGHDQYIYISKLALTPAVASVGDEGYTSVEAAVEAAATATDKTVTLIDNVTEDVALTEGVTLDLNGKTLTGTISVDGAKVKDSSNGSGLLKCEKSENGIFEADNGSYLPLYDDSKEGYRFFSYSAVAYQAKGEVTGTAQSAKFWFDIEFGSATDAYGLLDDLAVNLSLDWGTNEGDPQNYGFASSVVSAWAGAEADNTSTNYALYVTVTGIEELSANDTVSITPSATANGATISFKTITYTVQ